MHHADCQSGTTGRFVLISFEEILERRVVSSASEAVALALGAMTALDLRRRAGTDTGLPDDPHVLLNSSGDVILGVAEPSVAMDDVSAIGALLSRLLRLGAPPAERPVVPGALMVLIARALRQIDLPPQERAAVDAALRRFADDNLQAARAALFKRAVPAGTPPPPVAAAAPALPLPAIAAAVPDRRVAASRRARRIGASVVAGGGLLAAAALALMTTSPRPAPVAPRRQAVPIAAGGESARSQPLAAASQAAAVDRPVRHVDGIGVPHPLLTAAMVGRDAFSPSFGPAGRTIYFHAGRDAAPLMRASYDNGVISRVTPIVDDGANNYHVVASPDGSMIAFDSDREGERGVYVARSDGSDAVRVSGDGFGAVPSWSPDGRRLAFVKAERSNARVWNIWIADLRARQLQRVTHDTVGQPWGASWFPDGRRLAYSRERHLAILDLGTGATTTFESPVAGHLVRTPAVSPDGGRVVFQVYHDGTWMLDLASRRVHRVLADRTAEEFRWSPDGQRIVFHARNGRGWGVWTVAADATAGR